MNMQDYWNKNCQVGQFGIKYLDDKLEGIAKNDLIVIGARSGAGKTTIANKIFNTNKVNNRCKLFSLENFSGDLYSNNVLIEYKKITRQFDITPRQWLMGKIKVDYEALEVAERTINESLNDKYIITRQPEYTIEKLKNDMTAAVERDGCELLIIDHLDYIDKDNENKTDIGHITELMKKIRELQDIFHVAVVAVSHLRKPENLKQKIIIPNENEFIGSSNKVKEATAVIMFAPDDDGNMSGDTYLRQTWCCIRKNRFGGFDARCAKLTYNLKTDMYLDEYQIHAVDYLGTNTKLINGEK